MDKNELREMLKGIQETLIRNVKEDLENRIKLNAELAKMAEKQKTEGQ